MEVIGRLFNAISEFQSGSLEVTRLYMSKRTFNQIKAEIGCKLHFHFEPPRDRRLHGLQVVICELIPKGSIGFSVKYFEGEEIQISKIF